MNFYENLWRQNFHTLRCFRWLLIKEKFNHSVVVFHSGTLPHFTRVKVLKSCVFITDRLVRKIQSVGNHLKRLSKAIKLSDQLTFALDFIDVLCLQQILSSLIEFAFASCAFPFKWLQLIWFRQRLKTMFFGSFHFYIGTRYAQKRCTFEEDRNKSESKMKHALKRERLKFRFRIWSGGNIIESLKVTKFQSHQILVKVLLYFLKTVSITSTWSSNKETSACTHCNRRKTKDRKQAGSNKKIEKHM
jgi:hypothetical protein